MARGGEKKDLDIVVYGATGFTGQFILKELLRSAGPDVAVGAAGRNPAKIAKVIADASRELGTDVSSRVTTLVADLNDQDSLQKMTARAKVLVNAVGPYRKFGLPVVKACLDGSCSYLDICGEPEFIEKVDLLYGGTNGLAAQNECFVVSGVGFDSIPCDMGTLHNQLMMKEMGLVPSTVESYLTLKTGKSGGAVHYATYEALILGFANARNLKDIRRGLKERNAGNDRGAKKPVGPRPKRLTGAKFEPKLGAYCLPFLGSDASIVRRTQNALACADADFDPVHHSAMFTVASKWSLSLFAIFGGILQFLVKYKWGRTLLLNHPKLFTAGFFSHEGPSPKQIAETSFSMTFHGSGYASREEAAEVGAKPSRHLTTIIEGPEPGYVACSCFVSQAALTLLDEIQRTKKKNVCDYGVRTTGELLVKTDYLERLQAQKNGIRIKTLDGLW